MFDSYLSPCINFSFIEFRVEPLSKMNGILLCCGLTVGSNQGNLSKRSLENVFGCANNTLLASSDLEHRLKSVNLGGVFCLLISVY